MTRLPPERLRLYLVLDPGLVEDPVSAVRAAIRGGVTMVQLRWKEATDREIVELGHVILEACRLDGIPLLVNDRVDLALAIGADGVHLGVDDLPIPAARRISPEGFVIGYSPEFDSQILSAEHDGADYLGVGPFATTATKADAGHALGAEEFARRRRLTHLPVVAIGGIGIANARSAISAGADGIAVVSAILGSDDQTRAATELLKAVQATP